MSMNMRIKSIVTWLGSPAMVFYVMPFYMAMIAAGTIAQKDIGLYRSLQLYFGSPLFLVLTVILTVGILFRFLFHSEWKREKAGIHLAHLGVLILLAGGLMTAVFAREGYITIPEGEAKLFISDYHQRELLIVKDGDVLARVPHQKIQQGQVLNFTGLPLEISVLHNCKNCAISERQNAQDHMKGMARFMALGSSALEKEDEKNLYGATLDIRGVSEEQNGIYVVFEAMPKPIELMVDGSKVELIYGKAQRALPFAIRLNDFVEERYTGTEKARAFYSDIAVIEPDGLSWSVRIAMNEPLRYKGYTLFQSSFIRDENGGEATVLAVVENKGWLAPYLGTILMAVGLLWHVVLVNVKRGYMQ